MACTSSLVFLFFYSPSFFFLLFLFSGYLFSMKYNNRWGGTGRGRHRRRYGDGTREQEGPPDTSPFICFVCSTLLLSSFCSFYFLFISFSVKHNNRWGRAGRDGIDADVDNNAGWDRAGRGGRRRRREEGEGVARRARRTSRETEVGGDVDGRTAAENKAGGRAGQGGGRATLLLSCPRLRYLLKALKYFSDISTVQHNAPQMLL